MKAMVERNLFTGYSVGIQNPVFVSHLQFSNDTLLIGVKSWANICALRAVLLLFESMSGGGLWFRVLEARYGLEEGRVKAGDSRGSSWWREIAKIKDRGRGSAGEWFGESISKKVGDGSDTLLWIDPWLGERPLCERFRRLFDLSENKSGMVAKMASLGWETGGGVGVAEAVAGLGGGDVGGVSDFTSWCLFAGSTSR
ncbi:unnamed protein product [Trifolium pratense]|uniref:Uncharacterized protein n=1 Tax=Trifolium pratense TaxID=57577 RepID=A0ACB0IYA7_TRIPR|nr:unnamed protein product [Trifolium pratense]